MDNQPGLPLMGTAQASRLENRACVTFTRTSDQLGPRHPPQDRRTRRKSPPRTTVVPLRSSTRRGGCLTLGNHSGRLRHRQIRPRTITHRARVQSTHRRRRGERLRRRPLGGRKERALGMVATEHTNPTRTAVPSHRGRHPLARRRFDRPHQVTRNQPSNRRMGTHHIPRLLNSRARRDRRNRAQTGRTSHIPLNGAGRNHPRGKQAVERNPRARRLHGVGGTVHAEASRRHRRHYPHRQAQVLHHLGGRVLQPTPNRTREGDPAHTTPVGGHHHTITRHMGRLMGHLLQGRREQRLHRRSEVGKTHGHRAQVPHRILQTAVHLHRGKGRNATLGRTAPPTRSNHDRKHFIRHHPPLLRPRNHTAH